MSVPPLLCGLVECYVSVRSADCSSFRLSSARGWMIIAHRFTVGSRINTNKVCGADG